MRRAPSPRTGARYVHTNIVARDWKRLTRFYVRVFGCTVKQPERDLEGAWLDRLTAIRGAHLQGAHLALPGYGPGGPTLEIFQYSPAAAVKASRVNAPGIRHLAFAVKDVKKTLNRVVRCGGSSVGEVVSTHVEGVGAIEVVYGRDPEGNIIELQRWE